LAGLSGTYPAAPGVCRPWGGLPPLDHWGDDPAV